MRFNTSLFPSAALLATASCALTTNTTTGALPTVTLDYSTVQAIAGNTTVGFYKYQNIRFAAVPTGNLRFAKPEWPPLETAINTGSLADEDVDCAATEDCLYMDIWAPANSAGKKLPVMVFTYGGGFTGGSKTGNSPEGLFDLSQEFIFVTYNYRLGFTGISNGVTLLHQGGTSNVGLWDVEHAYKWIKKYISAFGGDPEEIVATGFSAGASQTLFQLTRFSGHNEQLYKRAYVMSPGFVPGAGHEHAEVFYQNVSTAVGCEGGNLECLRAVDFNTLQTAASTVTSDSLYQFQPRVDGDFVADTYESQLYQGRFNFTGNMVITHELHEANSQDYSGVDTTEDVSTYLRIFFPSITDAVIARCLALYPESDYSTPGLRFSDMKEHFDLTAHNLALTQALDNGTWNGLVALDQATHGTDQSYYFYKTYDLAIPSTQTNATTTTSAAAVATSSASNSTTGAPGGGMSGGGGGGPGSTASDPAIAVMMQKYMLSFVLTGDPNTLWPEDKINWPLYNTTAEGATLVLNSTFTAAGDDLLNEKVLFWNQALWY